MIIEILTVTLVLVTILMSVCIFLQKPEGNSFVSGATDTIANILAAQSSKNPIARATSILAVLFFALCLTIAILTSRTAGTSSVIDSLTTPQKQSSSD
ncbi:MAG: preprotein translocase subunit SecG [Alphaproteobacteria bacterium]|nr:preprotein translocase subunit SecG [Alphaproteobacteria bacterium]